MPPTVSGILESALYVDDVDRSVNFYRRLFGFEILTRGERICALSVSARQVLLLFKKGGSVRPTTFAGGTIPPTDGDGQLHLAFSIDSASLDEWRHWLAEQAVEIESTVEWERGGTSLYFRDPDNHAVELVTPGTWRIF